MTWKEQTWSGAWPIHALRQLDRAAVWSYLSVLFGILGVFRVSGLLVVLGLPVICRQWNETMLDSQRLQTPTAWQRATNATDSSTTYWYAARSDERAPSGVNTRWGWLQKLREPRRSMITITNKAQWGLSWAKTHVWKKKILTNVFASFFSEMLLMA